MQSIEHSTFQGVLIVYWASDGLSAGVVWEHRVKKSHCVSIPNPISLLWWLYLARANGSRARHFIPIAETIT